LKSLKIIYCVLWLFLSLLIACNRDREGKDDKDNNVVDTSTPSPAPSPPSSSGEYNVKVTFRGIVALVQDKKKVWALLPRLDNKNTGSLRVADFPVTSFPEHYGLISVAARNVICVGKGEEPCAKSCSLSGSQLSPKVRSLFSLSAPDVLEGFQPKQVNNLYSRQVELRPVNGFTGSDASLSQLSYVPNFSDLKVVSNNNDVSARADFFDGSLTARATKRLVGRFLLTKGNLQDDGTLQEGDWKFKFFADDGHQPSSIPTTLKKLAEEASVTTPYKAGVLSLVLLPIGRKQDSEAQTIGLCPAFDGDVVDIRVENVPAFDVLEAPPISMGAGLDDAATHFALFYPVLKTWNSPRFYPGKAGGGHASHPFCTLAIVPKEK
jgi:hypothetical protein